ncbi:helix-turn-helix domain-containing protein [Peribacillus sp. FSL H8-0477]|uniref:response regulator transcription factor n=1 Tax=Peribacillus sp. FSL H8-0477 TaxID=2921388 RepID=UPI0030F74D91
MINLLIVEDERMIRQGLLYTIDWTALGVSIVGEASNGQEGYDKIIELKPDIVLTDIKMPKMNGIEMLEAANQSHFFYKIILSSYSDFTYAQKGIKLEVFDYILKPVDEKILNAAISKLLLKISYDREMKSKTKKISYYEELLEGAGITKDEMNIYVRQTIDYVRENYQKKINIEDMAERFNVSASYLSRVFKKETNHTITDFLNRYRVMKSIALLLTNHYRIYEVAYEVGFSDYKHFCTVFKKYVSCSPSEFLHRDK